MKTNLDHINPLRGLNAAGLVGLQEQAMRGYYSLLMWTYFFFERSDPMIRGVKRRLLASLGCLGWSIKIIPSGNDERQKTMGAAQAKTLRAAYDAISNLRAALTFLALAELRGFSHLEKIYAREGDDPWLVKELRPVEQWFWARNGFYGDWLYNPTANENSGTVINLRDYVIRIVDDPADEVFADLSLKRRINDADWDGFLEDYGVPPMFIVGPPLESNKREAEYQRAAELAVSRARGALPYGTKLISPNVNGSGGVGVFRQRLEYLDGQIVIAGTSGKLTVLAESGTGTLAGGAQKEAFAEIAQAIADQISGVMQRQFDEPILKRCHPGEPILAYFEFAEVNKDRTRAVLADAKRAADAGFAMDADDLSERIGMKLTYTGDGR